MDFANYWASATDTADLGDTIEQSLRFNGSEYLTGNFSSSTFTFSFWVKRGKLDSSGIQYLTSSGASGISFNSDFINYFHSSTSYINTVKYRDLSAWYHIVLKQTGVGTDTVNIYVNNELQNTANGIALSATSNNFSIGRYQVGNAYHFEGYMADIRVVDGTALNPDSFGKYNDDGVWVPQDYTGSYGNEGFHLTFDSSQTNGIGHDSSGNGNNFTAFGFDTTAISSSNTDNDIDLNDTPTSNHATLNPLSSNSSVTLSAANMQASTTAYNVATGTLGMPPNTGKYYFEINYLLQNGNAIAGLVSPSGAPSSNTSPRALWCPKLNAIETAGLGTLSSIVDTGATSVSTANETVYKFAYDSDTQRLWIGEGSTWYRRNGDSANGDPAAGTNPLASSSDSQFATDAVWSIGTGGSSANTNADSYSINAGQHAFIYTPPTGFSALQTNNLPEPTIKNGREHFDIVTYTGNSSTNNITGLEFQPDFVWIKQRNAAENHFLTDSVRGAGEHLRSDSPNAEQDLSATFTAFTSDGFNLTGDISGRTQINDDTDTYIAWCWKAGTSYTPTVTGGFSSPSASINTDAGFGIYKVTGSNSQSSFTTGLDKDAEFIISKNLDNSYNWGVYHRAHCGAGPTNKFFNLNSNNGASTKGTNIWAQTGTTIEVDSYAETASNGDYIYYVWHSVEGYSKFGSYDGNSSTDNSFVYCGFKPALVILKASGGSSDWIVHNTTVSDSNPCENYLSPNNSLGETTGFDIDILSNGFKVRSNNGPPGTTSDVIFCAWAENPFGGENTPPATAR